MRATAAGLLAAVALSACSPAGMGTLTVFADPGKYDYHNCEQLAEQHKRASERERELKLLMDKAEQSPGGAFVNVIAYKTDYVSTTEEIKVIEAASRAKNCRTPTEPGTR